MNTLFTQKMLDSCIAPQSEIDEAIAHGEKMHFDDENGMTAYLWNGKTHVTEMQILPEVFTTSILVANGSEQNVAAGDKARCCAL